MKKKVFLAIPVAPGDEEIAEKYFRALKSAIEYENNIDIINDFEGAIGIDDKRGEIPLDLSFIIVLEKFRNFLYYEHAFCDSLLYKGYQLPTYIASAEHLFQYKIPNVVLDALPLCCILFSKRMRLTPSSSIRESHKLNTTVVLEEDKENLKVIPWQKKENTEKDLTVVNHN